MQQRLALIATFFTPTKSLRRIACCALVVVAVWLNVAAAQQPPHAAESPQLAGDNFAPPSYSDPGEPYPDSAYGGEYVECGDGIASGPHGNGYGDAYETPWWPGMNNFGFRNSRTHPRWSGSGSPLTGTSWLNRPYEFGIETGAFLMTRSVSSNTRENNDVLLATHIGWDWEHYWGTQFRVAYTTPELSSSVGDAQRHSNTLLMYDLTMLYYPWGDSRVRPYYRFGVGLTDLSFTNPAGNREDETLFTVPIGVGIKYQTKRWMALRAEAVDHIVFAQNSASSMQNWTLTFGLEWRFGGRPSRSWSSPGHRQTW